MNYSEPSLNPHPSVVMEDTVPQTSAKRAPRAHPPLTSRFLLSNPKRKAILARLNESEEGLNIPNLRDELRFKRGAVDHALKLLLEAGMVKRVIERRTRRGKSTVTFYVITAEGRELLRRFGIKRQF